MTSYDPTVVIAKSIQRTTANPEWISSRPVMSPSKTYAEMTANKLKKCYLGCKIILVPLNDKMAAS